MQSPPYAIIIEKIIENKYGEGIFFSVKKINKKGAESLDALLVITGETPPPVIGLTSRLFLLYYF